MSAYDPKRTSAGRPLFELSQISLMRTMISFTVVVGRSLRGWMSEVPLIAIVDDDALARDGIGELIESFGYKALAFESAQHFLASSVLAETTCLITDVQMPGLNGLELQEALKARGYQTPIILITAYPNDKHRTRALNNGAVGYLSKPFDERSLMECLTDAIKLHHKSGFGCREK